MATGGSSTGQGEDGQAGDEQSDEEDEDFDLFMDGGESSTDDSSGDESEASESGGEKEEAGSSKPPAKRKKPKGRDDEGSEKRKWKKKRCHNVPKRSIAPFMNFSIAERARLKEENLDLSTAEIARKLGQMWQNMSDEAKQPYIQAEIREKKRFEKKRATYRWHSMSWRGFRPRVTLDEEKETKSS